MKKMLATVLTMMMLLGCAAAEAPAGFEPLALENGAAVEIDLDGDGANELVTWSTAMLDEYDEESIVTVRAASGAECEWRSGMLHSARAWITDVDSNGLKEIFVSGDEMSDDYVTFCLNYTGTMLEQLQFADANRGDNAGGHFPWGYGLLESVRDNEIVLIGSQDVLGTYFARRTFALVDGRFEFADDGVWRVDIDPDDAEAWEYVSLELAQDAEVTFILDDGETAGTLSAGEKVMIHAFDKVSTAWFYTEDGREGYFTVAPDAEAGWGSLVNGIPEADLFLYVPYAD